MFISELSAVVSAFNAVVAVTSNTELVPIPPAAAVRFIVAPTTSATPSSVTLSIAPVESNVTSPVPASTNPTGKFPILSMFIAELSAVVFAFNAVVAVTSSTLVVPIPPLFAVRFIVAPTTSATPSFVTLSIAPFVEVILTFPLPAFTRFIVPFP